MKSLSITQYFIAACLLLAAATAQGREITDMAGRKVAVPDHIERVYGSAPPLTVLLQAVAPETMIGLSMNLQDEGKRYLPPRLAGLPVLGGVFGMGPEINAESVMSLRPDIAIAWKSPFIDQAMIEKTFAKMGLPVVFISLDTLSDWPPALLFLGKLLGQEERAKREADYVAHSMSVVGKAVASIPEKDRVRVYYAESPTGLATDCNHSFHTEAIELAGGYNVYRCEAKDHMGMEAVSLEQVIAFDPQIILAQDPRAARMMLGDPRWKGIRAVRDGRVYAIPRWPHNWLDRPPSLMRALGIQWLANLFYPERFPFDRLAETRRFYNLFLGVDPGDAEIDRLFQY